MSLRWSLPRVLHPRPPVETGGYKYHAPLERGAGSDFFSPRRFLRKLRHERGAPNPPQTALPRFPARGERDAFLPKLSGTNRCLSFALLSPSRIARSWRALLVCESSYSFQSSSRSVPSLCMRKRGTGIRRMGHFRDRLIVTHRARITSMQALLTPKEFIVPQTMALHGLGLERGYR